MNPKYFNPHVESAISTAEALGFEVIRSTSKTLLLDIDTDAQWVQFEKMLPIVREFVTVSEVERWLSKSKNTHVVIYLEKALGNTERTLLETILGSDPKRSLFAFGRLQAGVLEPGLLFKPKSKTTDHAKGGLAVSISDSHAPVMKDEGCQPGQIQDDPKTT